MTTYKEFTDLIDAIKSALVEKFGVLPDTAEEWLLTYITDAPESETRPAVQIAQEIFMERAG